MKRVLITEDEKMIRRGLHSMVQRSSVPVEEILEARNGQEAWQILQEQPVDLLITDIRMPVMDGLELVGRLPELAHPPLVLVVSGYDDFSYAVTMLRNGAHDYLLKPVEREKFYEAMQKLEQLYQQQEEEESDKEEQYLLALRYLLRSGSRQDEQRNQLISRYQTAFFPGSYRVFLCRELPEELQGMDSVSLENGRRAVLVADEDASALAAALPPPWGESTAHQGMDQLFTGCQQAEAAWKRSFFAAEGCCYAPWSYQRKCDLSDEQLVGMAGLGRYRDIIRLLESEIRAVARGEVPEDELADLCSQFIARLAVTYQNLIQDEEAEKFRQFWDFQDVNHWLSELKAWLEPLCKRIETEFADYENKRKIREAVQYVRENFRSPLNMATVSNYVSMNYSLFSLLFKQYTGSNFVSYLQNLRLEEAKKLLLETDWKVNEIGSRVGFSDEKHFLKMFKAAVGLSPTEWRKTGRRETGEG